MKSTNSLWLLAQSLVLAACAVSEPTRSPVPTAASDAIQGPSSAAGATAPSPAYRPGVGVIESASVVSLSPSQTMGYRLKMDDGSTQSVLQAGERFEAGDRVEVTDDGRLVGR